MFSNQASQLRNKQRGGSLKDRFVPKVSTYRTQGKIGLTLFPVCSHLYPPSQGTRLEMQSGECFQKRSFSPRLPLRTTQLCQGTRGTIDKPPGRASQPGTFPEMGTHFCLNSMPFSPATKYHCLHSNYLETLLSLGASSKLILWGVAYDVLL